MEIIINLFFSSLLITSFLGYMMLLKKVIDVRREFIPIIVFSSIACIVYFFGLFKLLYIGSILVMVTGLIAFLYTLLDMIKKKTPFSLSFSFFGVFWTVGTLFFFFLLFQSKLVHYDNFSHWGIAVKQMLSTNAFPTAQSNLIDFKNYPLGITSFIYYVCRFAGTSQATMIVAQGLLIFSCFYAMFGIISEKKRFLLYAFLGLACATLSFFNLTVRINNLLVDFLLPIYTLAIFAIAYQYRSDARRAFISALPLLALLTITKSTGIIFATIGLIFLFYMVFTHIKNTSKRKVVFLALITLLLVVFTYLSWTLHTKTAFSAIDNKFDLQTMTTEKTPKQIKEITTLFIRSSTDLSTRTAIGILAFNILGIGAIVFNAFILKEKWQLWKVLIALNIVVFLYYLGILGMYIISMPLDEAIWLAGFDRYASSIVILFVGGLGLVATVDIENSFYYKIGQRPDHKAFRTVKNKNYYQKGVLVCMAIATTILVSEYNGLFSIIQDYETSLPYKIRSITNDRWYENGQEDDRRYLLYASDQDEQITNFYIQYVGRYFLYAPQVDAINLFYEDNLNNLLSTYDYLIMVESDNNGQKLLDKHYDVDGQEGIYKIIKTDDDITLIPEDNNNNQ